MNHKTPYLLLTILTLCGIGLLTGAFILIGPEPEPTADSISASKTTDTATQPDKTTPFSTSNSPSTTSQQSPSSTPTGSSTGSGGSGGGNGGSSGASGENPAPSGTLNSSSTVCILVRPGNTAPLDCSVSELDENQVVVDIENTGQVPLTVDLTVEACSEIRTQEIQPQSVEKYTVPCSITTNTFESSITIGYANVQIERTEIYGIITGTIN